MLEHGGKVIKDGDSVHFVTYKPDAFGATEHREARIRGLRHKGDKWVASVELDDGKVFANINMAISREAGTWHPIGGYGCG
jgi:hypothetical protein